MQSKLKRPRDTSQLAKRIVDLSTENAVDPVEGKKARSGRAGGMKGGVTRMNALSEQERVRLAKKAAEARWGKKADPSRKRSA